MACSLSLEGISQYAVNKWVRLTHCIWLTMYRRFASGHVSSNIRLQIMIELIAIIIAHLEN
jgi:hypothetical protein